MLDHQSPIPLYYQIEEMLRQKIEAGTFRPGATLPTERELCEQFAVSRGPVRQALRNLEIAGLVYPVQGKGVLVTEQPFRPNPLLNASFFKEIARSGMKPASEVISQVTVHPAPAIAGILQLPETENVLLIKRLIKGDAIPLALAVTYLPERLFPGISGVDLTETALYDLINKRYRISIQRVRESFEPVLPDAAAARLLKLDLSKPSLLVHRISYSAAGPVDYTTLLVNADRCRYTLELPVS
ncbi:MAG: GntR family transcriptional regulator [Bacillota bacterium]|jgi:GntR family transcriptional regulator